MKSPRITQLTILSRQPQQRGARERGVEGEERGRGYRQSGGTFVSSMTVQVTVGAGSPVGTIAGEMTWFPASFTTPHTLQRILQSTPPSQNATNQHGMGEMGDRGRVHVHDIRNDDELLLRRYHRPAWDNLGRYEHALHIHCIWEGTTR
jgi:hypothetical protein